MKVTIKLFAAYRDLAGTDHLDMELPDRATVSDAARELVRLYPKIGGDPTRLVVAVNQEYADHKHALKNCDELAFIPPVSGGCND